MHLAPSASPRPAGSMLYTTTTKPRSSCNRNCAEAITVGGLTTVPSMMRPGCCPPSRIARAAMGMRLPWTSAESARGILVEGCDSIKRPSLAGRLRKFDAGTFLRLERASLIRCHVVGQFPLSTTHAAPPHVSPLRAGSLQVPLLFKAEIHRSVSRSRVSHEIRLCVPRTRARSRADTCRVVTCNNTIYTMPRYDSFYEGQLIPYLFYMGYPKKWDVK